MIEFLIGILLQPNTFEVKNPYIEVVRVAEAHEPTERERLEQYAASEAHRLGVSREKLFNLIYHESRWNPRTYNEGTNDRGIVQISERWHPEVSDEQAFDPYFSITWAAEMIADGRESEWVVCSCVKSARLTVSNLPRQNAEDFEPNTNLEHGKIAILDYNGIRHITAYKIAQEGILAVKEGNFKPCVLEDRLIPWEELNDHLVGFYTPE